MGEPLTDEEIAERLAASSRKALDKKRRATEAQIIQQAAHIAALEREVEELRQLAEVPNIWLCADCGLVMQLEHFDPSTGEVGTPRVQELPRCPNDDAPMRRQTWRENAKGHADGIDDLADERNRYREALEKSNALNIGLTELLDTDEPDMIAVLALLVDQAFIAVTALNPKGDEKTPDEGSAG